MNKQTCQQSRSILCFLVLNLLLLAGGCVARKHENWSLGSHAFLTAKYYGEKPEQQLACPRSLKYPSSIPKTPLVGRVGEPGEEINLAQPTPTKKDSILAYHLAEIAHQLLRDEVGMENPALYVLLFPVSRMGAFRIKVPLSLKPGMTVGVPTQNGELNLRHSFALLYLMVHESTEMFMVYPAIGDGARLYGDSQNRWVGEGMANLMSAVAIDRAVQKDLKIADCGYPKSLLAKYKKGHGLIKLKGWLPGQPNNGRYAAAEYLCYLWYQAAREQGHDKPIVEFVAWIQSFSAGPRHSQVLAWLQKTSGIDIKQYAEGVPIDEVLRYHTERWSDRGWNLPPGASEFK
jgi:hypothetical protein